MGLDVHFQDGRVSIKDSLGTSYDRSATCTSATSAEGEGKKREREVGIMGDYWILDRQIGRADFFHGILSFVRSLFLSQIDALIFMSCRFRASNTDGGVILSIRVDAGIRECTMEDKRRERGERRREREKKRKRKKKQKP